MMQEDEAWDKIASHMLIWSHWAGKKKPFGSSRETLGPDPRSQYGLCYAVSDLYYTRKIGRSAFNSMSNRLKLFAELNRIKSGFWWPRTRKGYLYRSQWAARMAHIVRIQRIQVPDYTPYWQR